MKTWFFILWIVGQEPTEVASNSRAHCEESRQIWLAHQPQPMISRCKFRESA